jgi:cell division protein FtsL
MGLSDFIGNLEKMMLILAIAILIVIIYFIAKRAAKR